MEKSKLLSILSLISFLLILTPDQKIHVPLGIGIFYMIWMSFVELKITLQSIFSILIFIGVYLKFSKKKYLKLTGYLITVLYISFILSKIKSIDIPFFLTALIHIVVASFDLYRTFYKKDDYPKKSCSNQERDFTYKYILNSKNILYFS